MVTQQQKSSLQKRMKGFFLLSEFLYVKIESLKRVSKPKSLYSKKVILIFCCFTTNLACFYTKQNKVMQYCSLALCHCISIISLIISLPVVNKISKIQAVYHDLDKGKLLCFILNLQFVYEFVVVCRGNNQAFDEEDAKCTGKSCPTIDCSPLRS